MPASHTLIISRTPSEASRNPSLRRPAAYLPGERVDVHAVVVAELEAPCIEQVERVVGRVLEVGLHQRPGQQRDLLELVQELALVGAQVPRVGHRSLLVVFTVHKSTRRGPNVAQTSGNPMAPRSGWRRPWSEDTSRHLRPTPATALRGQEVPGSNPGAPIGIRRRWRRWLCAHRLVGASPPSSTDAAEMRSSRG